MPINYVRMAAIATKLLSPPPVGSGMSVLLSRVVTATYDPVQGAQNSSEVNYFTTIGAWVAQSADYQVTGRGVGGVVRVSDVLSQDRTIVLDGSVEPTLSDLLLITGDNHPWQVLSITKIAPTTVPIAYRCVVRK